MHADNEITTTRDRNNEEILSPSPLSEERCAVDAALDTLQKKDAALDTSVTQSAHHGDGCSVGAVAELDEDS